MSLESELKEAERAGISISKDRLVSQIRASTQRQFIIVKDKKGIYAVVPILKNTSGT